MASQTGILPAFITSAGKDTKAPTPVYTPVQPGLIASSADHPVPFTFDNANEGARSDLPTLTEGELDDFVAFLRRLVSGRLPKADVVPLVLNAYNITQEPVNGKNAWSYFYPITYVSYDGKLGNGLDSEDQTNNGGGAGKAKGGKKRKRGDNGEEEEELTLATFRRGTISTPLIRLPDKVLADTYQPWHSIKPGDDGGANNSKKGATGNYRFICFIHSHRLFRESTRRSTAVYTISIWDREHEELTWHDTYAFERAERRLAIREFWGRVGAPGVKFMLPRKDFIPKIRFRTVYHACEQLEVAIRNHVDSTYTLWSVMAIALQHMNHGGSDLQVSIVPDRLEVFGGHRRDLLPRLFVHLLHLCLYSPRQGKVSQWNQNLGAFKTEKEITSFLRQFRIGYRMLWMKQWSWKELEDFMNGPYGGWLAKLESLPEYLRMEWT